MEGIKGIIVGWRDPNRIVIVVDLKQAGITLEIDDDQVERAG